MKYLFLAFLVQVLFPEKVLACRFAKEFSESVDVQQDFLKHKATESKYVLLGKISGERSPESDNFFNVEKTWTGSAPLKFKAGGGWCSAGNYGIGERYLLFSNDLSSPYYMKLVGLSEAKPFMEKLSAKKDFVGAINPAWQFCENNSECKAVKEKCGNKVGINKSHEKEYLDFLNSKESSRIDCKKEVGKKLVAVKNKCIDYFCE